MGETTIPKIDVASVRGPGVIKGSYLPRAANAISCLCPSFFEIPAPEVGLGRDYPKSSSTTGVAMCKLCNAE
jgi:hypothetical protein